LKKTAPTRDSEQTRRRILAALGQLLATSGFRDVGVNAIARQAGVDKVLIYRYFGGLPELLKAFASESGFWPTNDELQAEIAGDPAAATTAGRARLIQLGFGRALRKRRITQEIMRWELLERNELTDMLAHHRESQGNDLFASFEQPDGPDIRAIGSILSAGLTYLILRSSTADVYNGLHLNSEEDWARIERAVGFLVDASFPQQTPAPRPAARPRRRKTS
jgi:AcrR family transcriptional regulator